MEFSNFTSYDIFSGMLSLFAAVIGLAYPFILQLKERIQDRYISEKVIDWFQQEPSLCHFLTMLRVNIPIALLIPYLLYIFKCHERICITLLVIQSFFVCILLFYLMCLYKLMNIFGSYIEMANHTKSEDMERLAIVMLSADYRNDEDGYCVAKDRLYERITEIITNVAKEKNGRVTDFPEEVVQIIGKILLASERKDTYPRISLDTTPIPLLYDAIYNKTHPTRELRKFIWLHLGRLLRAGNTNWLKSYWEWASQFYRMMRYDMSYTKQECSEFFEMHVFFAAMVLYSHNKELMKYIMKYQDVNPGPPCLLFHNTNEIFKMLLDFDKRRDWPFKLVEPYLMYFFPNDVNADHNIFRVLCDYLVFSLLYLIANKYVSDTERYIIDEKLSKECLERDKEVLEWFRETVLVSIHKKYNHDYARETFRIVNLQILRLIKEYNKRIEKITKNSTISQDKLQAMKDEIIAENKRMNLPILKKEMEGDDIEKLTFKTQCSLKAHPGELLEFYSLSSVNFANVLIENMRYQFYAKLALLFLLNGSVHTYLIQYKDLQKALEKMGFNNDQHLLLNNGVSLWRYDLGYVKKENIINLERNKNNLFILKKENCPTFSY